MENIIWTIEELYKWACEKGIQNYTCLSNEEGCPINLYESEIVINKKEKIVYL